MAEVCFAAATDHVHPLRGAVARPQKAQSQLVLTCIVPIAQAPLEKGSDGGTRSQFVRLASKFSKAAGGLGQASIAKEHRRYDHEGR